MRTAALIESNQIILLPSFVLSSAGHSVWPSQLYSGRDIVLGTLAYDCLWVNSALDIIAIFIITVPGAEQGHV